MSDNNVTHKVGTDAVLLGAWVNIEGATRILDVGTGSGVIALMLAQRSAPDAKIEAIEVQSTDVQTASENVDRSPWPEKIAVTHAALQNFQPDGKYDLIVSNPPYFSDSLLPPAHNRTLARHNQQLTFDELLKFVADHLSRSGLLAVVLPPAEASRFKDLARKFELNVHRQATFKSRNHKPVERWLLEFGFAHKETQQSELLLYRENDEWTDEYRALVKDFYLKA